MNQSHQIAGTALKVALAIVTLPLLLGGLIAAGESKDALILLCGGVSLLVFAAVGLATRKPVQT